MVGLRRLFNTGASPRSEYGLPGKTISPDLDTLSNDDSYAPSHGPSTTGLSSPFSSELGNPILSSVNHHFIGIERQFEQLHEQCHARPLSAISQLRYGAAAETNTSRPAKHVDLVEALFSSHRYRIASRSLSPTTPYNEDIAERNLHPPAPTKNPERNPRYTRIMSVMYQEDVADRNIARSKSHSSLRNSKSACDSWESEPKRRSLSRPRSVRRGRETVNTKKGDPKEARTSSAHGNLDSGSRHVSTAGRNMTLRPRVSAPDLSTESRSLRMSTGPAPVTSGNKSVARPSITVNSPGNEQPVDALALQHPPRPTLSRPGSRKNILDLSINTDITSSQKPAVKIDHRAIPPRTPDHRSIAQNASIAEIVHSPLPTASLTAFTPQLSPSYNVDEIMSMFKQAYNTTQATSPNHPTFETLQDAIIREINSHDAFRRVPIPDAGPPFTPPVSDESFDEVILLPPPGPSRVGRNLSERESQFSKLIRKGSSIRKRNKSISSTHNSLKSGGGGGDKSSKRDSQSSRIKRRHTYAQPPSAEWIQSIQSGDPIASRTTSNPTSPPNAQMGSLQQQQQPPQRPVFRSHLKRKSDPVPPSPGFADFTSQPEYPGYQIGIDHPHHHSYPGASQAAAAQAQVRRDNRAAAAEGPTTTSAAPEQQIQAIDDNNVMYIINATAPLTPLELITASQQRASSRRKNIMDRLEVPRPRSAVSFRGNKKSVPLRQSSLHREL